MAKITLTDTATLQDIVAAINANNAALEAFAETVLSRNGTAPNAMESDLDMNSRRIINLPLPVSPTEPLRLQEAVGVEVVIPPVTPFSLTLLDDTSASDARTTLGLDSVLTDIAALQSTRFQNVVVQVFTSSGTYTPTAGMKFCIVRAQAPGGGSGGADSDGATTVSSGGGGGGEYAEGRFTAAQIGVSQVVTIGAVGAAGNTTGSNGGVGGTVSLGSLITAIGGGGGQGSGSASNSSASRAGGTGGTGGTGGYFRIPGQLGGASQVITDGSTFTLLSPARGGSAYLGRETRPTTEGSTTSSISVAGGNYGSGAAGAVTRSTGGLAGQTGGPGIIIITEFI